MTNYLSLDIYNKNCHLLLVYKTELIQIIIKTLFFFNCEFILSCFLTSRVFFIVIISRRDKQKKKLIKSEYKKI